MSRSKWKSLPALKSCKKVILNNLINISNRSCTVTPGCVGRHFRIHNGKFLINIQIKNLMVGRKFGEISFTRKLAVHKK